MHAFLISVSTRALLFDVTAKQAKINKPQCTRNLGGISPDLITAVCSAAVCASTVWVTKKKNQPQPPFHFLYLFMLTYSFV